MNADPISLAEFRRRVLALYQHKARKTYLRMAQVLSILDGLGVESTAHLTTETAAAFVASRGPGANPRTTIGLLTYLRAATNYAVEEGWLDRAPRCRRVWPQEGRPQRRRALSAEEVGRLLGSLYNRIDDWQAHRLFAMVSTTALTGLRFGELVGLQLGDVALGDGILRLTPRLRPYKTAASVQPVPMPDQAVEVLEAWLARSRCRSHWVFPGVKGLGPWTTGAPGYRPLDRLQAAGSAVGLPDVTWHGLRHTYATLAAREWGVPLWAIQRILRHTSARTTERYLHLDDAPALRRVVAGVGYRFSG